VNEELTTAPEKINTDAHSAWILTLELSDPGEIATLLSAEDYQKFIAEEGAH
jgi:glycine cleavage system H protein